MLKKAAAKALWVTKGAALFGGSVVTLALLFGVATVALAAVPGDPFRLGQVNTINQLTQLVGNTNGAMLRVNNNSAGSDATALTLLTEPSRPPMTVSSQARVPRLNADKLDGKHASDFLPNATYTNSQTTSGTDIGGGVRLAEEFCDAGDVLLSGGHFNLDAGTTLVASGPDDFHEGWQLQWINDGTADSIDVSAYCADFGTQHVP